MGHKNRTPLQTQVRIALDDMLRTGTSKHTDKESGTAGDGIYSWSTYRTYMKHCVYFVMYCKENYHCRTLDQCRAYVDEWLESRQGLSTYTQKLERSALCKLYRCSSADFDTKIERRTYAGVTRSRQPATRDRHFSEAKNAELVEFARSTGLRRNELQRLTGSSLVQRNGQYFISVTVGAKGGRDRLAPVVGDVALVVRLMRAAGDAHVFSHIHSAADIHSYRREYAQRLYDSLARPLDVCKADTGFVQPGHTYADQNAVYYRRGELKGSWLDKRAMLEVSQALGHNRISVVGEHYLK